MFPIELVYQAHIGEVRHRDARSPAVPRSISTMGRLGASSWCRISSNHHNRSNHMNVRHLVPSVSRRLLSMGFLILAASLHYASGEDLSKYKRIEPQFIAALGDPGATSGNGAQSWGFWNQDPGPRACK